MTAGLAAAPEYGAIKQITCLGLGSPCQCAAARVQLALVPILRQLFPAVERVICCDPVLTAADREILQQFDCVMLQDESAARVIKDAVLLYMPHCEAALYNDVLDDNWRPETLEGVVLLGNSLSAIAVRRLSAAHADGKGHSATTCALSCAIDRCLNALQIMAHLSVAH